MHPKHKPQRVSGGEKLHGILQKYFVLTYYPLFKKFKIYCKCDYNNLPNTPVG